MKKNFMTRALSVVLSAAMALSLSVVANVASADAAAAKPAFKKATKTIAADKKLVKFYTTKKTKKNFTLTKVKTASADIKVSVNKAKQVITVKRAAAELAADASATIKCTFKNKKTTKKVTKSVKVNVIANKAAEEEVKVDALSFTLKATANDTLQATFNKSISKDAKITVVLADTKADIEAEKIDIAEDGLTATYKCKARFVKGNYTMTVTDGEEKAEQTIALEKEAATQIVLTSKTALTNGAAIGTKVAGSVAYIYYDVLNQYGESVRTATSLNWTTSASKASVDQVSGKITVENGECKQPFMYGSQIMVVAVDTKTGLTLNDSVTVGMAQKLDTVDMVGFLDKKAPTKILTELPANFAAKRYLLLFQAKDQNGNVIDDVDVSKDVQFFTDAVTIIDSSSLKAEEDTYTVDGEDYYAVTVEPGMYSDKGGEVVITAISSGTGNKSEKNFVVGSAGRLQSLTLSVPAIVADGDQGVALSYVAKDTNGNEIKNYETIVRSTNQLTINSSEGTLKIAEDNKGEAVITWSDDAAYVNTFNTKDPTKNNNAFAKDGKNVMDGQDRLVTLNTIVVGGESSYVMMNVKDARKPFEISKITMGDGVVTKGKLDLCLATSDTVGWERSTVYFKDQYGTDLKETDALAFFTATQLDDNKTYGLQLDIAGAGLLKSGWGWQTNNVYSGLDPYTANGGKFSYGGSGYAYHDGILYDKDATKELTDTITTDSLKFTIVCKEMDTTAALTAATENLSTASKKKTHTVSEYPFALVQNRVYIKDIAMKHVDVAAPKGKKPSDFANFADYASANGSTMDEIVAPITGLTVKNEAKVEFAVNYDGKTMDVDGGYYLTTGYSNSNADIDPATGAAIEADVNAELAKVVVSGGVVTTIQDELLKWNDLYDSNSARGTRKTADVTVKVVDKLASAKAASTDKVVFLTKSFKVTDAAPAASNIWINNSWPNITVNGDQITLNASNMGYDFANASVSIKDQYGDDVTGKPSFEFSATTESADVLTHVPNSLKVEDNTKVAGAEIGDTFTLKVSCGGASATYKVTVGADTAAYIANTKGSNDDSDITWRKTATKNGGLGYTR